MGNEEDSNIIEELDCDEKLMVMKVDLSFFSMAGVSRNATLKLYGHIAH